MPKERIGYFGWDGFGGSVMQWHPKLKIGFAYVPTKLHWYHAYSHIGARLQSIAVDCVKRQQYTFVDRFVHHFKSVSNVFVR